MTSRYKQPKQRVLAGLFFSALLVLSAVMLVEQVAFAQSNNLARHKLLAQNKQEDDTGNNTDRQFQAPQNDGDNASHWSRNTGGQRFGGNGQQCDDMPGWRMRRRLGASAQGGANLPARQWRDGSNFGSYGMSGHNAQGANGELPLFHNRGDGAFGPGRGQGAGARAGQGAGQRPGQGAGQNALFGNRPLDLTPLALSDEQKAQVKEMRQQTKLKIKELRKSVVERQADLRNLLFSPDATEDQIRAARSQLRQMQDKVDETNMESLLSIRAMLTPEQRKRWTDCRPGRNAPAAPAAGAAAR